MRHLPRRLLQDQALLRRNEVDARVITRITRQASEGYSDPAFPRFPDGSDSQTFTSSGSASGVGDILIRGKVNIARNDNAGAAVALDLRLPTGDEDNLLGTGGTQAKLFFIGSAIFGKFAPHINLGYTFSDGGSELIGELSDEINLAAAFDVALHPRVSFSTEVNWRTILDANQVRSREEPFIFRRHDSPEVHTVMRPTLATEQEDLNFALAMVGAKVNLANTILLTANLSFSLTSEGLQDKDVIPLIGVDYSF